MECALLQYLFFALVARPSWHKLTTVAASPVCSRRYITESSLLQPCRIAHDTKLACMVRGAQSLVKTRPKRTARTRVNGAKHGCGAVATRIQAIYDVAVNIQRASVRIHPDTAVCSECTWAHLHRIKRRGRHRPKSGIGQIGVLAHRRCRTARRLYCPPRTSRLLAHHPGREPGHRGLPQGHRTYPRSYPDQFWPHRTAG